MLSLLALGLPGLVPSGVAAGTMAFMLRAVFRDRSIPPVAGIGLSLGAVICGVIAGAIAWMLTLLAIAQF